MTLAALLLRQRFFSRNAPKGFMYATVGVLFVNISIGGTLTPYAAPPVLMVADKWGLDLAYDAHDVRLEGRRWRSWSTPRRGVRLSQVPARAAHDVARAGEDRGAAAGSSPAHLAFLRQRRHLQPPRRSSSLPLFLFFLGFTEAYRRYQTRLMIREGLMVAFFLGGPCRARGAAEMVAAAGARRHGSDGALLRRHAAHCHHRQCGADLSGSLVDGVSETSSTRWWPAPSPAAGLTVIANAPNPAGFAILKGSFEDGAIGALGLLAAATPPTLVAVAAFQLLPG